MGFLGEPGLTTYYNNCLEEGLQFQDYATEWLYNEGLPLVTFVSVSRSLSGDENKAGIEIKLDKRFRETGNLYIETAEKPRSDSASWVESGICRGGSWLLAIGDKNTLWLIPFNILRMMWKSGKYRLVENPTSKGFLLPVAVADKWAAKKIDKP